MQITKAMELVASSKLRGAKLRAEQSRPYFNVLHQTLADIVASTQDFYSPYTARREVKKRCYVVIAGDRGLAGGYQTPEQAQQAFDACRQGYLDDGMSDAEADARAASIVPRPGCNESVTGFAAEILAEGYDTKDTGFADTDAFRWLSAYAADYGFILRWPEDRQAATGMVFEPWHWRYVGVENARAMFASGLSLEEFLAVSRLS